MAEESEAHVSDSEKSDLQDSEKLSNGLLDCNPPPPPELVGNQEANADVIRGTVIDKKWVLETMMQAVKEVESNSDIITDRKPEMIDLDSVVEEEMCKLWDMSMDVAVAEYMMNVDAPNTLLSVILKSHISRLTEICIGIIGNLACNLEYCDAIFDNDDIINTVMILLDFPDPALLVQVVRLINIGIVTPSTSSIWRTALMAQQASIQSTLSFIMYSSTSAELLKTMAEFLDNILDIDDALCEKLSSSDLVGGIVEAMKELQYSYPETNNTYWHILQVISTKSIEAIQRHRETVFQLFIVYMRAIFEDDFVFVDGKECGLASAVTVVISLCTEEHGSELLKKEPKLLGQLVRLLALVSSPEENSSESSPAVPKINILKEALGMFWCNVIQVLSLPSFVLEELEKSPDKDLKFLVAHLKEASAEDFDYFEYCKHKANSCGFNKLSELFNS